MESGKNIAWSEQKKGLHPPLQYFLESLKETFENSFLIKTSISPNVNLSGEAIEGCIFLKSLNRIYQAVSITRAA